MAFFNSLSKTISEKGKEAARKAKVMTEVMQLRGQISTEEEVIQAAYQEIGKQVYERALEADAELFAESFEKIRNAKDRILELESAINRVEGVRLCAKCGTKISQDAAFCNNCGTKLEIIIEEDTAESGEVVAAENEATVVEKPENICPSCGKTVEAGSSFCMVCGTSLKKADGE